MNDCVINFAHSRSIPIAQFKGRRYGKKLHSYTFVRTYDDIGISNHIIRIQGRYSIAIWISSKTSITIRLNEFILLLIFFPYK